MGHVADGRRVALPNLWEHYQFTGDKKYLAENLSGHERRGAILPRHARRGADPPLARHLPVAVAGKPHPAGASICAGPTMDMEILRDLFANCIQASEILGRDKKFRQQLAATRARLAPLQIGSAGQLQEWLEDWDTNAPDIHHRHVSHLYGLFPSDQIDVHTPELAPPP
jgi:alpha-L-fucosidase 2